MVTLAITTGAGAASTAATAASTVGTGAPVPEPATSPPPSSSSVTAAASSLPPPDNTTTATTAPITATTAPIAIHAPDFLRGAPLVKPGGVDSTSVWFCGTAMGAAVIRRGIASAAGGGGAIIVAADGGIASTISVACACTGPVVRGGATTAWLAVAAVPSCAAPIAVVEYAGSPAVAA